jgi:UDP-N-acetylglucosamine 2-epimerase (non-hydrolysing)
VGSGRGDGSVAVVFGTRPEIIKLAPILELLGDRAWIVYTGQHFDDNMSRVFFDQMALPSPDLELGIGGLTRASQIGRGVQRLETVIGAAGPDIVLVQGDTNSTLAGALAANSLEIPLVHVEAGLRSFDRSMPEEHNRVLTDHLADLLLAPTPVAVANLEAERIAAPIVNTGNTIVDVVLDVLPSADDRAGILHRRSLSPGSYHLATFHRPENVDDPTVLRNILLHLGGLDEPVVLPIHPRTRHRIESAEMGLLLDDLEVTEPVGYAEFLSLSADCRCLITDSGGIQEEASVLRKPVVVVRHSTERPEILGVFGERIEDPKSIPDAIAALTTPERLSVIASAPCPYGSGDAASRSIAAIDEEFAV